MKRFCSYPNFVLLIGLFSWYNTLNAPPIFLFSLENLCNNVYIYSVNLRAKFHCQVLKGRFNYVYRPQNILTKIYPVLYGIRFL